jgi:hypothetical protein
VSVVGSYPRAAGLKTTGLGGLDGTGDGGSGGSLEGGSRKRVAVGGGGTGDVCVVVVVEGVSSGAISGGTGGTGGGTRVGLAGRDRWGCGVGAGHSVVSMRI